MDQNVPEMHFGAGGEVHYPDVCMDPAAMEFPAQDEGRVAGTEAILLALAQAVENRDSPTARHCERLALTSVALGRALQLDQASLVALYRGAFLHDVGKVAIPDAILLNPTRLTPKQWTVMRSHTIRGEQMCRHIPALRQVLPIIRHHHERFDGSGYPDGLHGVQIPLLARVLQIADIYDALTSARPYKPAYSVKQALQIIEEETKQGWRDPEIVNLFFKLHSGVVSRIRRVSLVRNHCFEEIRHELLSLDAALAAESVSAEHFGIARANGRISAHPPRFVPLNGSLEEAEGRSHTA
jgi:HD-GYP domain-containing protein (c-di-GMP phosphodiesterase class II)